MDCCSLTESGGSSSSSPPISSAESVNGLKFGHKFYFEDVGIDRDLPKSNGCSNLSTSSKKARARGAVEAPKCQVEGCKLDLTHAKPYYSRHKVCTMHSKFPMVLVAGLEQRFCQQCSRFHQLPEFDQGKRSCRRRLAGHNERRRKPPPGFLLSTHYGRFSSSIFENSSRVGNFLMDFRAYQKTTGKNVWSSSGTKASERVPGKQSISVMGKYITHPWQSHSDNRPSELFLPVSAGGTSFSGPGNPSGECINGVDSDSSCALSLLSNQTWGSRNRIELVAQTTSGHAATNHFPTMSWDLTSDLGLNHQVSQTLTSSFSGDVQFPHQGKRPYMELGHSGGFDFTPPHHLYWSL